MSKYLTFTFYFCTAFLTSSLPMQAKEDNDQANKLHYTEDEGSSHEAEATLEAHQEEHHDVTPPAAPANVPTVPTPPVPAPVKDQAASQASSIKTPSVTPAPAAAPAPAPAKPTTPAPAAHHDDHDHDLDHDHAPVAAPAKQATPSGKEAGAVQAPANKNQPVTAPAAAPAEHHDDHDHDHDHDQTSAAATAKPTSPPTSGSKEAQAKPAEDLSALKTSELEAGTELEKTAEAEHASLDQLQQLIDTAGKNPTPEQAKKISQAASNYIDTAEKADKAEKKLAQTKQQVTTTMIQRGVSSNSPREPSF